jgi:glyoxalase family protein
MTNHTSGIHHVTCVAGDAQENLDFYVGVLGMRLVKRSVNQDAPDTYHLFYADADGTPGTDLTFFPWPGMGATRPGTGSITEIDLAVPIGSMDYWRKRLSENGVALGEIETRFGEATLPFFDPHGLRLALVETASERPFSAWHESPVPPEFQVRGMHSVRLCVRALEPTESLLALMGFTPIREENGWHRFGVGDGGSGALVEVQELPDQPRGRLGVGGVHHVAWRTRDAAHEMALRAEIQKTGLQPTTLIDRFWFESVYFREPGGVLFELATDGPGFAVDEDAERLGEQLVLPPWLEAQRAEIEAQLPPLQMPSTPGEAA